VKTNSQNKSPLTIPLPIAGDVQNGKKYGWKLLRIERNQNNPVLKWNCVFNGQTEFPDYLEETEED
jgi:hypothetical protein